MTHAPCFDVEDLLLEKRIIDIHLIPDSALALCAVTAIDKASLQESTSLWTFCLKSSERRQLTHGQAGDDHPRWSPDGRQIAFLSDRGKAGTSQVHLMPVDGGEARPLGHLERGASQLCWHPSGDRLLVLGNVTVDPEQRAGGCARTDGATAPAPSADAPQLCWRLPYKLDGTGYLLDTRCHLFLVDARDGHCRQLTHGDFDVQHMAWAPDGKRFVFCRTRDEPGQAHCT
ncbi:MAG TPA: S9 family peptidase, partial [Burkholderiaceae bacterium]|nr:S9 family peptidase [Burkholderiaceae bacterium]